MAGHEAQKSGSMKRGNVCICLDYIRGLKSQTRNKKLCVGSLLFKQQFSDSEKRILSDFRFL